MEKLTATCLKCGLTFGAERRGRPPRYCSSGCRRAVEYEIRRLQRHIESQEAQGATWSRIATDEGYEPLHRNAEKRAAAHEAERLRLEARLKELLDDLEAGRRDPT